MGAGAARKLATYEDLLALPEEERVELIGGELLASPAPLPEHGRAQAMLGHLVGGPFDAGRGGPGGWWILVEVDVRLGPHDVVRPDLSGWRRGRLPDPWGQRPVDVTPDWVCEILSPSSALRDLRDKKRLYGQRGVPHYWLIDPQRRSLTALQREPVGDPAGPAGWRWVELGTWGPEETVAIPPFEAVALPLRLLFPPSGEGTPAGAGDEGPTG